LIGLLVRKLGASINQLFSVKIYL